MSSTDKNCTERTFGEVINVSTRNDSFLSAKGLQSAGIVTEM